MSKYGRPITDWANNLPDTTELLAEYLNKGALSLFLGSGASAGFGLSGWKDLVLACVKSVDSSFVAKSDYTNAELKELMDFVKEKDSANYLNIIHKNLYGTATFDFSFVKDKDLLIAITALVVGTTRGTVRNIFTYNFDDVLEWYLSVNGLSVNILTPENLINRNSDVEITHIHGFLPFNPKNGRRSRELVFSKIEFEDRQEGESYWKLLMREFFKRNIFVTIGVSPGSVRDDIFPILRRLDAWYEQEKLERNHPFGIVFLTPSTETDSIIPACVKHGIVPIVISIPDIPAAIFEIAQKAQVVR